MKKGDTVFVIKWKYIDNKFTYYVEPMIYTTTTTNYGCYIHCRSMAYRGLEIASDTIYSRAFTPKSNRVFETLEEAEANARHRQIEHDIKKKYELLAKKELEGK